MKIKTFFIDARKASITELELDTEQQRALYAMYPHIETDIVQVAMKLENDDTIWVDEEGLFKGLPYYFSVTGGHQDFAGSAIVAGSDDEGNCVDVKSSLADIRGMVKFLFRHPLHKVMEPVEMRP